MARFRTRARTVDMLGRQQIAGIPTAISELFKNAHDAYADHVERQLAVGARLHPLIKPMLGLYTGRPGARLFRRHLSENAVRDGAGIAVLRDALSFVRERRAA